MSDGPSQTGRVKRESFSFKEVFFMIKPEVTKGCCVPKGWGEEIIIENNELYCGKVLIFNKGCKFSMHYHMKKDECWYVEQGEFV